MGKQGVSQWAVFQRGSVYQIENRRNFSRFNKKVWTGQSIFTRGQFWPSGIVVACVCVYVCVCLCVRQSWACPSDNSSTVQARITKFGPEKQNTLVKIPVVFFGQWTLTFKVKFNFKLKIDPILSLSEPFLTTYSS